MKKKFTAMLLAAILMMSLGNVAYAADQAPLEETPGDEGEVTYEYVETNPEVLAQIVEEDGLDVPEGMQLVSVKTTVVQFDEDFEQPSAVVEPAATSTTYITNVRTTGNKYYSNDYDSYWYNGPMSFTRNFSLTRNAGWSSSASVSASMVSSAVGFNVTGSYFKMGSHSTTVASGISMNLRVHMNYQVKAFDVYQQSVKIGSGSAWVPIGLLFKEYRYTA